jgi:hypothetical protein
VSVLRSFRDKDIRRTAAEVRALAEQSRGQHDDRTRAKVQRPQPLKIRGNVPRLGRWESNENLGRTRRERVDEDEASDVKWVSGRERRDQQTSE